MPTVIDPYGTPSVSYNRDGPNIQEITLTAGGGDVTLQSPSSHPIYVVDAVGFPMPDKLILPAGADIGTTVEVFVKNGASITVGVASGDDINGLYSTGTLNGRGRLVKYAANSWAM